MMRHKTQWIINTFYQKIIDKRDTILFYIFKMYKNIAEKPVKKPVRSSDHEFIYFKLNMCILPAV